MQQIDMPAGADYVPRHAAWLNTHEADGGVAAPLVQPAPLVQSTSAVQPAAIVETAPPALLHAQPEPAQSDYQFPAAFADGAESNGDYVTVTDRKRFWRGRNSGGAPRSSTVSA